MKKHIRELISTPISTLIVLLGIIISMLSLKIFFELYQGGINYYNDYPNYINQNEALRIESEDNNIYLKVYDILEKNNIEFSSTPFDVIISSKNLTQKINTLTNFNFNIRPDDVDMIEGEFFTETNNEYKIVIGSILKKYTEEIDGKRFLRLEDKLYEVSGIFEESQVSLWNFSMFIDFKSMPNKYRERVSGNIIIKKGTAKEIQSLLLENNIYTTRINAEVYNNEISSEAKSLTSRDTKEIIPLLIIGIINGVIFSILWAMDMKRNIHVKKILGAKNCHILYDLFCKITILTLVASIVINIIYIQLLSFLKDAFELIANFTLLNSLKATSISLALSTFTLFIIYIFIMKNKFLKSMR